MKAVKTNYQDGAGVGISYWVIDSFNFNNLRGVAQLSARISGYLSEELKISGKSPATSKNIIVKANEIDINGDIPKQIIDRFVKEKFLEGCSVSIV